MVVWISWLNCVRSLAGSHSTDENKLYELHAVCYTLTFILLAVGEIPKMRLASRLVIFGSNPPL